MIEINRLNKSYGRKNVLNQLNARFLPRKIYGIVGRNGAGKTTLFQCIAGFEDFTGQITANHAPLKDHLGYLPTHPHFLQYMTGREYLHLICHARKIPVPDFSQYNLFNLPLNEYASNYSTGMKKKLAFTGILLAPYAYYIFDEPFNGVDIQSNILMTEMILRLREQNRLIIIASHIFATLKDICDQIFLLEQGRFEQEVLPPDYERLGQEVRQTIIGDKVDQLFTMWNK